MEPSTVPVPRELLTAVIRHLAYAAGLAAAEEPDRAQHLMNLSAALADAQEDADSE